jgi:hypothetical protein
VGTKQSLWEQKKTDAPGQGLRLTDKAFNGYASPLRKVRWRSYGLRLTSVGCNVAASGQTLVGLGLVSPLGALFGPPPPFRQNNVPGNRITFLLIAFGKGGVADTQ